MQLMRVRTGALFIEFNKQGGNRENVRVIKNIYVNFIIAFQCSYDEQENYSNRFNYLS